MGMGLSGLEPPTSRLSGVRSNQLSYKPIFFFKFGGHLLSHTVSSAVPSADQVLTIVFGMGTGVSPDRIATRSIELYSVSAVSLFPLNSALLHFGLRSILHIHPVCHMRSRKQASIAPLSSSLCTHSLITKQ